MVSGRWSWVLLCCCVFVRIYLSHSVVVYVCFPVIQPLFDPVLCGCLFSCLCVGVLIRSHHFGGRDWKYGSVCFRSNHKNVRWTMRNGKMWTCDGSVD